MRQLKKILLYVNTVKYLKFTQVWHQISKRILRSDRKRKLKQTKKLCAGEMTPIKLLIPTLDLDQMYLARFRVKDLLENKIEILHEKHEVDLRKWKVAEASHLWNYNLHYLEFLIPLAEADRGDPTGLYFQKWCEYVDSWMQYPSEDSFAPYTISMRIPNLLICMNILQEKIRGSELEKKLADSIYQQYRYLLVTQEKDLLANHYFENLKTILICSVLFGEKRNYRRYFARFRKQIAEQILPDGLHYERSIMYHKIILENILRVYVVLHSSGKEEDAAKLLPVLENMAAALASVSYGFQKTPLFNDSGDNVAKNTKCLLKAVQEITGREIFNHRTNFETSGYYKLYAGENTLLFDCGEIGPSYMSGHAHCDCLSFEMTRNGKALFVNSGTYQYQGEFRPFFRSTIAHNTIMIDNREQAELWGEHRAARRISKTECSVGEQSVSGRFQSFCGDWFARKIELTEGYVKFTDHVIAKDNRQHCASQFFHIAPGCRYVEDAGQQFSIWAGHKELAVLKLSAGSKGTIHRRGAVCVMAEDFGERKNKEVLEIRTPFVKEITIKVCVRLL